MKLYPLAILLCLAACQKVELPQPDEPEEWGVIDITEEDKIAVTGEAFRVGPVSADIYLYTNSVDQLFLSDALPNRATIQFCKDGLFANGNDVMPEYTTDESGRPNYFDGNRALVHLDCLQPATTYHYRAHVVIGDATRYGKIRKFTTPSLNLPDGSVDLGLSVKWSSSNVDGQYKQSELPVISEGWRVPTASNFGELIENCICADAIIENQNGLMCTAPNGNSIFFPAVPPTYDGSLSETGIAPIGNAEAFFGSYWCAEEGFAFSFGKKPNVGKTDFHYLRSLRLVQ